MIYKSSIGDVDLSRLTRLYAAGVVELHGEVAEMSLEWIDMNEDKVNIKEYVLVFDFTPKGDEKKDKKTIHFGSKDELMITMQEVAKFFQT